MEPVNDLGRLGRLAAEDQDARVDGLVNLDAARGRFLNAAASRSAGSRSKVVAVAIVSLAACIALFVLATREPAPLTFQVGEQGRIGEIDAWLEASPERSLPIRFSDGSEVRLAPGARGRVTRVAATGATVRMENGRANVSVTKRKHAAWHVSLGPFRVDVTGTRFDVDWDPARDELFLQMHEGSVVVSGCAFGKGRPVVGGEIARASCRGARLEISTGTKGATTKELAGETRVKAEGPGAGQGVLDAGSESTDAHPAPSAGEVRNGSGGATRAGPSSTTADWSELLHNGRHAAALDAAEAAGFSSECARASAADLVLLGDAARFTGRLERANEAYQTVRRRFPGHERSAVAAFALGRIAFDQRGDYAGAARWFRTYLGEEPGGRLDRDALGRLMESLSRLGDTTGARTEAARYLEKYPTGPHAEMARRLTAE